MNIKGLAAAILGPLLILAACSPQAASEAVPASSAETPAVHPVSGLEVIPLSIVSDGERHDFRVEVAGSPQEQARGLMFRTEMGADEGMLFPREVARPASFWMKNTVLPLDIIFIGADRRILNIAENTVPYSEESVPSQGDALAILELNGGRTAELGIEAGDRVDW